MYHKTEVYDEEGRVFEHILARTRSQHRKSQHGITMIESALIEIRGEEKRIKLEHIHAIKVRCRHLRPPIPDCATGVAATVAAGVAAAVAAATTHAARLTQAWLCRTAGRWRRNRRCALSPPVEQSSSHCNVVEQRAPLTAPGLCVAGACGGLLGPATVLGRGAQELQCLPYCTAGRDQVRVYSILPS